MTERAECFAAMRNLARQVTGQCLLRRLETSFTVHVWLCASGLTTAQGMLTPMHKRSCIGICFGVMSVQGLSKVHHPYVSLTPCLAPGLWMARREELGHPLGVIPPPPDPEPVTIQPEASTSGRTGDSADFVLEIGSEELPPDDVMTAVQQLRSVCSSYSK